MSVLALTLLSLSLLRKRWAYAGFVVLAVLAIPARTGFRLVRPACDLMPNAAQLVASVGNVPHIVLFTMFYLVSAVQFTGALWSRLAWPALITSGFGVMLELGQGATRTGNCELHDLLPNTIGVAIGVAIVASWILLHRRRSASARV